jgi:DNA repair photolyase
MNVREIICRTLLTRTGITSFDYVINPYVGCEHGCRYCYAAFMKRFTGHLEPWGGFVDVKVNGPAALRRQLRRARPGKVLLSSVTDPYQPLEKKYGLTRSSLEALLDVQFPVTVLTRSPLCLRDIDLFKRFERISVGFSVGTHDEAMRRLLEPHSPSIRSRLGALAALHGEGIPTWVFIGPMLPLDPAALVKGLLGAVDEVFIDRLNYPNKVVSLYRRAGLERYLQEDYFRLFGQDLKDRFEKEGVPVEILF